MTPDRLIDTQIAAIITRRAPSTIRRWATTGRITRHGKDPTGRTLYSLTDVLTAARQATLTRPRKPAPISTNTPDQAPNLTPSITKRTLGRSNTAMPAPRKPAP